MRFAISSPSSTSSTRRLLGVAWVLGLLSLGLQLMPGHAIPVTRFQLTWLSVAAAIALVPGIAAWADARLERLRALSPRARSIATVLVGAAATAYLVYTALSHGRYLGPQWDDEHSYIIQTRMLAQGRLWGRLHPLADFFETFHFLIQPVYSSIYFPGTALLNVPAIWLKLPIWIVPMAMAGLVAGLTYRIVAELLDDVSGMLAALLIVADIEFQDLSTRVMGQTPAALMGLLLVWAWLHWRRVLPGAAAVDQDESWPSPQNQPHADARSRRTLWAVAMGGFVGWAIIIRPFDALAFSIPVAAAVLLDLRRATWRMRLGTAAAIVTGVVPFLALQLIFNVGVTGKILSTPYAFEQQQELPGMLPGFRPFDPAERPTSSLLRKHLLYDTYTDQMREHTPRNIPKLFWGLLRHATSLAIAPELLVLVAPLSLLIGWRKRRWAFWAGLPLFCALYVLYPIFLAHYMVAVVPVASFCVVLGAAALVTLSPSPRYQRFARVFIPLAILGITIGTLPEINHQNELDMRGSFTVRELDEILHAKVHAPAIVLFDFTPDSPYAYEWVYNSDVAWPDDAPVIRAHDLGDRNGELFAYYDARQGDRRVYRYDCAAQEIRYLGTIHALHPPTRGQATRQDH